MSDAAADQREPLRIVVGTKNPAKLRAAEQACIQMFPDRTIAVTGVAVPSNVRDQPLSDEECITGATNRAKAALAAHPDSHFALGIEGGAQKVGERWFESGWTVVLHPDGRTGVGSSGRYELSPKIMARLLAGTELADVVDDISGMKDVRSTQGAMGLVTNGLVPRDTAYVHGIMFAFGPFVAKAALW
ncbi:hypothetical protein HK105_205448 [Polyrhizophydium stewartii]|uniref:inosine/xanthosine triphosphatase n=1 Tax=Polyrhizophydium stewartii TaxID=2732419 RepID=A0ABR4N5T6_9FUNG|nr:hypothetical protein HK105_006424 [Polyrhizophydium stewartii]